MVDEAHVIRVISWKDLFPFTLIFRSFRVAIHPSKLVLALLALVSVYVGGSVLDAIWPVDYRALPGEMRDFETAGGTGVPYSFSILREERKTAYENNIKDQLVAIGKPNGSASDLKQSILQDRDAQVKGAQDEFAKSPTPAAKVVRDVAVKQAYDIAAAHWDEVNRPTVGLFRTFVVYELGQLNKTVRAVRVGNIIADGGVVSSLVAFFTVGPVWALRNHPAYFTVFGLFFLTVWSVFGGAITRIAAVHIARDEKISIRQALAFSTSKFLSFVSAPIIPLLIVLAVGLVIAVGGILTNIPFLGPIVIGALFFLALVAGFVITLVLLGLAGGFNMMYPTIAVEGSDSFDAISRSFSYLYARPWRLGFYTAVALAYGALTYLFVRYFIYLLLSLVHIFTGLFIFTHADNLAPLWQTLWPSPDSIGRLSYDIDWLSLSVGERIGAVLVAFWVHLVVAMLGAFTISFYFSVNTVIYYLMRREVDATELDDVYLEQTDEEFAETPAGPAPSGEAASPASVPGDATFSVAAVPPPMDETR